MAKFANRRRRFIGYEAARIMADEGVRDYRIAKHKACLRLGTATNQFIPTNLEVEDALAEQLSIFAKDVVGERQRYLATALDIMNLFADYSPKLTGAAVSGIITSSRPVEVYIFPSTYEEICAQLDDAGLSYRQIEKRKRFAGKRLANIPGFELHSTEVDVELFCFLPDLPYPPLSSVSGKPIKSVSRKKVRRLLAHHCQSCVAIRH